MRISMTGGKGCVGRYLSRIGVHDLGCDVTNPLEIQKAIKYAKPDVIVHLASKSDVDWCEKKENAKTVSNVNLRGTFNVAESAFKVGCDMVLMSSDHVFDGGWFGGSYKETSRPNPKNFYGMSKMGAESLSYAYSSLKVIRTSYLFTYDRLKSHLNNERREYPVFIKRSFMYLPHFANSLFYYLRHFDQMPKILHISGSESISWYEFACSLAQEYGYGESHIVPRKNEVEGFAPRGRSLGLNTELSRKLGFEQWSYLQGIRQMKADNE